MKKSTRGCSIRSYARSALGVAALLFVSGCGGAGSASDDPAVEPQAEVPQTPETNALGETLCATYDLGVDEATGLSMARQEIYSFERINERLEQHPELAREIGIESVSDCEGARLFMKRSYEAKQRHPELELDGPTKEEQFEKFLSDPRNIATEELERPEVQKIFAGQAAQAPRTVQIIRQLTATKYYACSASRLAGPIFLTSNHCLPNPTTDGAKSFQVYVRRQRPSNGAIGFVGGGNGKWLHAYALGYPGYTGAGDWDRDLAIIYINKDHHPLLAAEADTFTADMLIATRTPHAGDQQRYIGWGAHNNDPVNFGSSIVRQVSQDWPLEHVQSHYFYNQLNLATNPITIMCHGDSGGPSTRLTMLDGVFAGFAPENFSTNCPGLDVNVIWSRVDTKIEWLKETLATLQRNLPSPYHCVFVPALTDPIPNNYEHEHAYLSCYQQ